MTQSLTTLLFPHQFEGDRFPQMLAYQVTVNGKLVATAGVEQGVVSGIANWVSIPLEAEDERDEKWRAGFSLAALDGITSEHLQFFRCDVQVGDEILIKLIETDRVDEPTARKPRTSTGSAQVSDGRSPATS